MVYTPIAGFAGAIEGTDTRWQTLITNHADIQDDLAPPIVDMPRVITSTSTTYQTRLRFYIRRNAAIHGVRFVVRAAATTGTGTIRANVGANNATATITGAVTNYTIDVVGDDDAECTIEMKVTSGGDSITMYALQAYIVTRRARRVEWSASIAARPDGPALLPRQRRATGNQRQDVRNLGRRERDDADASRTALDSSERLGNQDMPNRCVHDRHRVGKLPLASRFENHLLVVDGLALDHDGDRARTARRVGLRHADGFD